MRVCACVRVCVPARFRETEKGGERERERVGREGGKEGEKTFLVVDAII